LEPGHFNAVAKGVLRRVPLFGWLFKAVGFLFLARSWEADRPRIAAWSAAALRHARPMWLLLYPEGTRFTARAAAKSDAAAVAAGVAPLRCELLLPRTRGFSTLADALAPRFAAVMDCTIAYVGADGALMRWGQLGTSAITALAAGTLPLSRVDVHVEMFPFATLPRGDEALGAWLNERWRRKEALLLHAQTHGEFPDAKPGVGEAPVPPFRTAFACGLYGVGIIAVAQMLRASFAFRMCVETRCACVPALCILTCCCTLQVYPFDQRRVCAVRERGPAGVVAAPRVDTHCCRSQTIRASGGPRPRS
jgi:1-acyl-sn-glycerol-3-phosphate acyltransferase